MSLPIIMADGSGSRLWPLSRHLDPKQFLALGDGRLSMLQATTTRLRGLETALPGLICNEEHRFLAAEQLRRLGMEARRPTSCLTRWAATPRRRLHWLPCRRQGKAKIPCYWYSRPII